MPMSIRAPPITFHRDTLPGTLCRDVRVPRIGRLNRGPPTPSTHPIATVPVHYTATIPVYSFLFSHSSFCFLIWRKRKPAKHFTPRPAVCIGAQPQDEGKSTDFLCSPMKKEHENIKDNCTSALEGELMRPWGGINAFYALFARPRRPSVGGGLTTSQAKCKIHVRWR